MKKILAAVLAIVMIAIMCACTPKVQLTTYEQFKAAALETEVTVETYIQAKQSWWNDKATIYTQNEEGAYFLYELPCSKDDYDNKLTIGTKIRVTGHKAEWAGEVEIIDATYEVLKGNYIAPVTDVTSALGTDKLIDYINMKVAFKGMTVEAYDDTGAAFAYKDAEGKTDDLYFKVSKDGQTYGFCVEFYLCGKDTDVYKAVEALKVGDKIDLEGFLYWYNGANPHITSIKAAE